MTTTSGISFESSVVLDGTKTRAHAVMNVAMFESSVVLDGTKTDRVTYVYGEPFESSVVLDGTKTRLGDLPVVR